MSRISLGHPTTVRRGLGAKIRTVGRHRPELHVPTLRDGRLVIASNRYWLQGDDREIVPPTDAGWERFLAAWRASEVKWTAANAVGKWWWGRGVPRG